MASQSCLRDGALLQGLVLDDEKVHTASGQCKRHLLGLKEILEVLLDVCKTERVLGVFLC